MRDSALIIFEESRKIVRFLGLGLLSGFFKTKKERKIWKHLYEAVKSGEIEIHVKPNRVVFGKFGWCVGRNPPFVVCGIRLIGLPAPSGRFLIGACLPFPLAGRPFHRFHKANSAT